MMLTWQAFLASFIFVAVIFFVMTEWLNMTIVAFLGAMFLVFFNIMTLPEAINYINQSHGTLALFFGVMVLIRAFEPTKVFEYLATKIVILAKGRGNILLLGIVAMTTVISAFLPNATTVMILAPLIPPIAAEIGIDFVPLLILIVLIANSAGLLTLVGDPATFIVGDAINMSFTNYLQKLTLGGVIAIVTVVVMIPWLFREIWQKKLTDIEHLPHPQINHPRILSIGGIIISFVLIFFVVGDYLPVPVSPAAVALLGAALALLLAHHSHIDSVNKILRDIDWSTLLFFMSMFVLIGGLEKTGVISNLSKLLSLVLGTNLVLGSILVLFFVGFLSSLTPNIPLVVAVIPLLKQYLVSVKLAPPAVLDSNFAGQFSPEVLPLFYAMILGATLGGNGTLVGASANIVAAGIAELHGERISFQRFLKYGLPVMVMQLLTAAIYVTVRFFL